MESFDVLLAKFRTATANMQKLANDTPRIIGNESVKIVKTNFALQGYDTGLGLKKWEPRKDSTNKAYDRGKGEDDKYRTGKNATYKGSVFSSSNPLLEQTRRLYNSIKYKAISKTVKIGVDLLLVPYAEAMNDTRKYMPAGEEPPNVKMLTAYKKKITNERHKIMKEFKK